MDRKFLESLGLEKEAIDKVMAEHGKTIQAAKPTDYDDLKSTKETLEKQVEELNGTLTATNDKYTQQESTLGDLQKQVKGYEVDTLKNRIASQVGLPLNLAGRLTGTTEDELKADAENFASFVSKPSPLPLKPTEPAGKSKNNDEDIREIVQKLNGTGE